MNQRIVSVIIACSFLAFSCSKTSFATEQEFLTYIQDEANNYIQKKTVKDIEFTLLYKPTDLLVVKELKGTENHKEITELKTRYSKYLYFNLSISYKNKDLLSTVPKNRHQFGQMVKQLSFGMRENIYLFTQQKDTLEMTDFVYPRMYGMSNATTIMLVYPRKDEKLKTDFLYLTLKDLGIGTGEIKFKIPTEIIDNEPSLTFKS